MLLYAYYFLHADYANTLAPPYTPHTSSSLRHAALIAVFLLLYVDFHTGFFLLSLYDFHTSTFSILHVKAGYFH